VSEENKYMKIISEFTDVLLKITFRKNHRICAPPVLLLQQNIVLKFMHIFWKLFSTKTGGRNMGILF
jgi:hypothetical protein